MAGMQAMDQVAFNEARQFGVEVEFFGVNWQTVVASLRRNGIEAAYESYNHETRRHWKIVTDQSVTSTNTGLGKGLELVSPPLQGREGLAELKKVLTVLAATGAKVDRTCGIHVHHHAAGLAVENFKTLYGIYYKFETWIDSMVAPSRRGNKNVYCKGISGYLMKEVQGASTLDDLKRILADRYIKLNFCSYFRHGTIEFRHHGGSVDAEKIANWVVFTQSMVERAKGSKIRLPEDRDAAEVEKLERQFRRMVFGDYKAGCLDNEYGQAFLFQVSRRKHFEGRVE